MGPVNHAGVAVSRVDGDAIGAEAVRRVAPDGVRILDDPVVLRAELAADGDGAGPHSANG